MDSLNPHLLHHPLRFRTPLPQNPDAPLFIFLPGMDGTGELLRLQLESLGTVFDIRCLVIPPDDLTSWDDLANQVITLVQAELDANPRLQVYLCGESFGGCLTLKVAQRAARLTKPNQTPLFDRVILVNPASAIRRMPLLRSLSAFTNWLPAFTYLPGSFVLFPLLGALHRLTPDVAQELLHATQSVSPKSAYWRVELIRTFEIAPIELATIVQPVLVVASGSDRLLPSIEEGRALVQQLPNAQLHILPQSGHTCLLETDVHLYQILDETGFLDMVPQVDRAIA